jgi:methyl-accepting chemotaxis protein
MKRVKFRNKLMFMGLSMVIFVSIVSTIVAFFVINNQNRDASNDLLNRSSNIIIDDLLEIREKLLSDSRQLATINNMASGIQYILENNRQFEEISMKQTYQAVVQNLYNSAVSEDIWKVGFYDTSGDIVAFSNIEDEGIFLGYTHRFPQLTFNVASLKPGMELKTGSWKHLSKLPGTVKEKFGSEIPRHEVVSFEKVDNYVCLVSYVPVVGELYSEETKEVEKKQIAFVTATRKLEKNFIDKISRLTGMKINIFTRAGLSLGHLGGYNTVQMEYIEQSKKKWDLEKQEILLNEIAIESNTYFQGVLPIYSNSNYVGSIAALYSKSIVKANTWQMIKLLALVSLGCILMIIPVTFLFSNMLTKPINRIIKILNENSDQVAAASGQISSASQSLAEGASEQASSLEETSSSLEEMASMTRQNADNATQADNLMKEANRTVENANSSMEQLTNSMKEISQSSAETQKIVKTIDEIAFQTNLLALNAAVEAARAGEAGAGFAVVADEVRNLAMRAADAAKNTSGLIEGTVKRIKDGSNLVITTNEAFTEVATSASKVGELVGEIAAASNEQAQGIEQVNKAVAEMDKMTQQNAANAEESAGASVQMKGQAEQMKGVVGELLSLIGSEEKSNGRVKIPYQENKLDRKNMDTKKHVGDQRRNTDKSEGSTNNKKEHIKPYKVIPMDDKDFKDF